MQPSPSTSSTFLGVKTTFDSLVEALSQALGPSSGLDSEGVDIRALEDLMKNYASDESAWSKYAFKDPSRGYTRNLVDKGNGKSNLLVVVWTPAKGSPVHDHANAHCIMKILRGRLTETRYDWPGVEAAQLPIKQETTFQENDVTYMSDTLGLHKIWNPDPENFAVSLHLYTPPNAAKFGCSIFDESTGKASHISQTNFFSQFGYKV